MPKQKYDKTEVLNELGAFDTGYQFKLINFEGPLDLLYHLIKESKMEISEIKLADITDQYLTYLNSLQELDMDKASDFIDMAATLLEIKSKYLLPRDDDGNIDDNDAEIDLLRQLKELELFKEAGEKLKGSENVDRFYKEPDEKVNDYRFILGELKMEGLLNALANMLTRIQVKEKVEAPKKIAKDRFTVAEKIFEIRERVRAKGTIKFSEMLDVDASKSEIINAFLALLELLKLQQIKAVQTDFGDDIEISAGDNLGELTEEQIKSISENDIEINDE